MRGIVDMLHEVIPCQCGIVAYGGTVCSSELWRAPRTVIHLILDVSDMANIQVTSVPFPHAYTEDMKDEFFRCPQCGEDWWRWRGLLSTSNRKSLGRLS